MAAPTVDETLDQAIADHADGHHDQAEAGFRLVLDADPDNADALNLLGLLLQENGRYPESIALIGRALAIDPDFPEALTNLARVQRVTGDAAAAVQSAERAVALDPDLAEAHLQLGCGLIDLRRGAEAASALRRGLALRPQCRDAALNLGAALLLQAKPEEALAAFQALLQPDQHDLQAMIGSGVALGHLNRLDEALAWHRRAVDRAPHLADAHAALALTLRYRLDPLASAEACRGALAIAPERTDLWLLLGANLACVGQFDEALACHARALSLNPQSAEAWRDRSMLGQTVDRDDVMRLQGVLDDARAPEAERIAAGFSLGRLLDRTDMFDAAFAAYEAANRIIRSALSRSGKGFDLAGLRQQVDWLIATFRPDVFARFAGCGDPSTCPVFIVGMPRSGTTLVEQIAASHAAVFGAGERKDIQALVSQLSDQGGDASPLRWDAALVGKVAAEHIARLTVLAGGAARIIDKLPDNIQLLGQIAVLFPNARIILCRRDLRDSCLSAFFQQFDDGLSWTSDLADCAARAQEIERLVAHWRAVLPLPMLEVGYEDLVSDLEGQSRRLIDFLGLDWDPNCLRFHETQRPVMTASYWQVRQPLYTSACGRWQSYRRHLAPLLLGLIGLVPVPEPEDWDRILADPDAALRGAVMHHQAGRFKAADLIYRECLLRDPNRMRPNDAMSTEALCALAKTLRAQGQAEHAEAVWRRLLVRHPDQIEILNGLTEAVAAQGRYDDAISLQRQATERFPGNCLLLYQLAWLLWRSFNPGAAIEVCAVGIKLDPGLIELWLLLGSCQLSVGQFADAAQSYRHALVLDPASGAAYAGLVQAGEVAQADMILARSKAVMSRVDLPLEQRIAAAFAVARDHEAREEYDAAFAAYVDANRLVRVSRARGGKVGDDGLAALRGYVDWAIQTFRPETFGAGGDLANPSELPAYIVGMPRSGTTLVEQIAASHPLVFGAGERTDLEAVLGLDEGRQILVPPQAWDVPRIRGMTDALLATLRQRGGDAIRVINKLPDNILLLGQIALLFPKARIIVCRRDPCDVCLSCFSQNFFAPNMAWTDTLEGCALRTQEIERLLAHWRQILPSAFLEIQYEALVDDLEGESRRLIEALGVVWDPACLAFHKTERAVMTASNWQVRQPLYATSVGKWRHYRKHLSPLLRGLQGLIPDAD